MINKEEIFKKAGNILEELTEQYQYIDENPKELNDLELELLSANADFLAENLRILRKLNAKKAERTFNTAPANENTYTSTPFDFTEKHQSAYNTTPAITENDTYKETSNEEVIRTEELINHFETEEILPEPVIEEPVKEEVKEPEPVSVPVPEPVKVHEPYTAPRPAYQPEAETKYPSVSVPSPVNPTSAASISAYQQAKVQSLNDMMSAQKTQQPQSVHSRQVPTGDLKSSINLNDKLLFIKDLFNGYSLAYSEAIEILNRFESFESADNFLKSNYAEKNNWASKQSSVDKLYEVLHKRFAR